MTTGWPLRYRTVKTMEKKRNKDPYEGRVWPAHAERNKVLCPLQRCMRKEYEQMWLEREEGHEKEKGS